MGVRTRFPTQQLLNQGPPGQNLSTDVDPSESGLVLPGNPTHDETPTARIPWPFPSVLSG